LAEIAGNFASDPAEIGPIQTGHRLLSVASEDSRDVEVLNKAALQRMALDYRDT
jgi:hypothetical protein